MKIQVNGEWGKTDKDVYDFKSQTPTRSVTVMEFPGGVTLKFFFWYNELIAVDKNGDKTIVQNVGSNNYRASTGKGMALNYIDPDKKKRVCKEEFEERIENILKSVGFNSLCRICGAIISEQDEKEMVSTDVNIQTT
jgi:hypothetical protein